MIKKMYAVVNEAGHLRSRLYDGVGGAKCFLTNHKRWSNFRGCRVSEIILTVGKTVVGAEEYLMINEL